jgi:dipeptidyl aminopeptidase/acylaminoacyl peptidase
VKRRLFLPLVFYATLALAQNAQRVPTVDDLLTLKTVGGTEISPDGRWVAYAVSETDFDKDDFVTQVWLVDSTTGKAVQLTRGDKGASNYQWSPDGSWLTFTSTRAGDKSQIFAIRPDAGEAVQLTKTETGVNSYSWARDGKSIAFTAAEPVPQQEKDRKEYLGDYKVVRREYSHIHIWTFGVAEALEKQVSGKQRTKGKEFSVGSFSWSPDGTRIAFSASINPDLIQGATADIYLLNLANDEVKKIVSQPGPDNNPRWSPDGKSIVFSSALGDPNYYAKNSHLAIVSADGGTPRSITDNFDENPGLLDWNADGIYFSSLQKTSSHLFRVDPSSGLISRVTTPDGLMAGGCSLSRDGRRVAFSASSPESMNEIYVSDVSNFSPRALTHMADASKAFILGKRELISWKSRDGATIEGVLIKPADFDPAKKYPLLCVIHGGPTGIDRPNLLGGDTRYYPSDIWVARGALVLKVNYRGSAGYGEKFRTLNIRNLGVGDAWDVLSGVDYLISKGWADPAKVGCMGWSQGGYISAFLTTSSDRFAAISGGAAETGKLALSCPRDPLSSAPIACAACSSSGPYTACTADSPSITPMRPVGREKMKSGSKPCPAIA